MKFTIERNVFKDVLSRIQGLTGRKTSIDITETVLLQAFEDRLTITATDLETGFEGHYPAKIETEGTIAINSKKLFEIVRDYPEDLLPVHEVENRWIEIGTKKVLYHIVGLNSDDFPETPVIEEIETVELPLSHIKRMIDCTAYISYATDERRNHLKGVYFHQEKNDDQTMIKMVSTDGSRLSACEYPVDVDLNIPVDAGILLPKKGLIEAARSLEGDGTARIGYRHNQFVIQKETETIIMLLLEGEFPNYSGIIQRDGGSEIRVNRNELLMMVRRMSILSSDEYKGVIFKFDNDNLLITTTNPNLGESKEDMPIAYQGEPVEIAFNPRYFIDTMSLIHDDIVILNIMNYKLPCLVRGETDENFITAIMPMRL